jgi:threonine aldolase
MRQIGILCAAALVALKENVGKLESDHKKTRFLAGRSIYAIQNEAHAVLSLHEIL